MPRLGIEKDQRPLAPTVPLGRRGRRRQRRHDRALEAFERRRLDGLQFEQFTMARPFHTGRVEIRAAPLQDRQSAAPSSMELEPPKAVRHVGRALSRHGPEQLYEQAAVREIGV